MPEWIQQGLLLSFDCALALMAVVKKLSKNKRDLAVAVSGIILFSFIVYAFIVALCCCLTWWKKKRRCIFKIT
jgi:lipopolysaccharide export LptBFGC system permease protein LptF